MWPCATRFLRRYHSYGRSRCYTWTRWRSSNGRNRTSSSRPSTRNSSASIAERATRRGTSSRRCRADRSASSVPDLARSRWVRPSRKRDTRRSRGPGGPEVATLPRKNPRAGSDENDLDDERRGNTSVVNRSIDRVHGPSRRETIEKRLLPVSRITQRQRESWQSFTLR